jgi:hypothetical protein
MIEVTDEWAVVDKWWTETPMRKEYKEVLWENGEKYVYVREPEIDPVWRLVKKSS